MTEQLYRYVPIAEVDLEKLEDKKLYPFKVHGGTSPLHFGVMYGDVLKAAQEKTLEIQVAFSPKQVSDKKIEKEIDKSWLSFEYKLNGGLYSTTFFEAFRIGAKWMRSQLIGKQSLTSDAPEFAEWVADSYRPLAPNKGRWNSNKYGDFKQYRTEELYKLFKEETK